MTEQPTIEQQRPARRMVHPDVKLWKLSAFDARYELYMKKVGSYREAYYLTERDFFRIFGEYRYSSYASFRASRSERMNRKRKESTT